LAERRRAAFAGADRQEWAEHVAVAIAVGEGGEPTFAVATRYLASASEADTPSRKGNCEALSAAQSVPWRLKLLVRNMLSKLCSSNAERISNRLN